MFLALREIKYSKLRFLLIGIIMILITWLVFLISGLANGLSSENASSFQNIEATHFIVQPNADKKLSRSRISEDKWAEIQKLSSPGGVTPFGQKMLSIVKQGTDHKIDIAVFATDANGFLAPDVIEGKKLRNDAKNEVVVDQSLSEKGIHIGDWIQDPDTDQKWQVVGFTRGQMYSHSPVVFMNLHDWQTIAMRQTAETTTYYNAISVRMDSSQINVLQSKVKDIDIISKEDALQNIPGYKEEQSTLNMMMVFLFVIASFVQAVFFYVITLQKTSMYGVLKAIGANTAKLTRSLVVQMLFIIALVIMCSIGLSYGAQALISPSVPFQLEIGTMVLFSGLFFVVSIIGSLLSLYQILKIDAVEAIGRVD
ncbi:ABC transporter permease [Baia soyae]|uniref:Putative hemin transport system permease protein HrtB n=1 Tax=Baia soyae TaxID=1544746 RepID=A0A4R2RGD0_9BACL|nr:ABC transporter permease [Baia soyae]TCP62732.1 putative ABC transport system permease protein [Baia soyae]